MSANTVRRRRRDFAEIRNHEPSAWLRSRLGHLHVGLTAGRVRVDPHLVPGDVVVAALWAPGAVCCRACSLSALHVPHGSQEDRRCDRCGLVGDLVRPYVTHPWPTLVVLFGVCESCHRKEVGR